MGTGNFANSMTLGHEVSHLAGLFLGSSIPAHFPPIGRPIITNAANWITPSLSSWIGIEV